MVCEWGMSEDLGALTYGKKEEQIFLGREIGQHRDFSEDTARLIDIEVKKIIDSAMIRVTSMLEEHRDILVRMSEDLLEKETIVLADIEAMIEELRPGKYTEQIDKARAARKLAMNKKSAAPRETAEATPEAPPSPSSDSEPPASPTPPGPNWSKPDGPDSQP
jgi:cell division protease FtsH